MTETNMPAPPFYKYNYLLLAVSLLIIAIFFLFPPVTVLNKTHLVGYAICHQIPARTFHIDGVALPLCARCTGIYLGALMGLTGLTVMGRYRYIAMPPTALLITLIGFIGIMGFDGLNSYMTFFPNAPHLYEPQNWLRLTTGTFNGLAMSVIVYPVINGSLWRPRLVRNEPVLRDFKELLPFLAGGIVIIFITMTAHPLLLYPLTILSTLGVLLMLGIVNTGLMLILTRREGHAQSWGDAILPAAMGFAVSFLMIGGMDWLRATLTQAMGLPI
jgi:uncharacterized membrane protein